MLSKTDVIAYWYKQKKYAIPMVNPSGDSLDHKNTYITVRGNNWLVAMCVHPHAASTIAGFNSQAGIGLYSQRMNGEYPNFQFDSDKPWLLRMNTNKTQWEVRYDFDNIEELHESIITFHKANAIDQILLRIQMNRTLYMGDVDACQGRIYQAKANQARKIIDEKIESDDFMQYPFVSGYARVEGLSLQDAAKNIIIKAELNDAGLAETESLRLRSQKAVLNATTMKELHETYERFLVELAKYGDL